MSIYPKPKPSNGVFNPSNYTYIKDSIVDVDLTGYIQKSGDVMSGNSSFAIIEFIWRWTSIIQ